ncbi:MAG: PAC2 family protein [Actinobacteria bacterium]|nr:PAC2 family protein [Actinomycetota bacterium]MBE3074740.1 PAC2 family protein [Actinomycetota bacterium]
MQDPSELYTFETDTPFGDLPASVLLVSLGGFVDAGQTQRLLTDHVLATLPHTVVATFDVDQLMDYRGRRPAMMFDRDRFSSYADPTLLLYRVTDADGQPFLVLYGHEPDYQWERVIEAIQQLNQRLGVTLTVSVHGIPMAVPHTRPIGRTAHATSPRLIGEHDSLFGAVQVPGSISALLELRLGESGHDALGFAIHVPHYLAQAQFADAAVVGLEAFVAATGLNIPAEDLVATAGLNRAEIVQEIADSDEVTQVVEALERQYDAYLQGRQKPGLLATDVRDLPTADEIGAEFEEFLRTQADEG